MKRQSRRPLTKLAALSLLTGLGLQAAPASAEVFTAEQASAGRGGYATQCAMCHGAELLGPNAPALVGRDVMQNYDTAAALYSYMSVAMPPQAPGRLDEETYVNILAYILQANGAQPGDEELTADMARLGTIKLAEVTAAGPSSASDSGSAAPATDVPQAFTWGQTLPSLLDTPEEAEPSVPQAFTWGKELPSVRD